MSGQHAGFAVWWEAARPRTLPAAIAPVLAASALAAHDGVFKAGAALMCLVFALLIQIGTNYANDYFDFQKGADTAARVGPRRAVAAGLIKPTTMKAAMILVFAIAFIAGLSLLRYGGWPLLAVGVASIVCGIIYTGGPYPLAYYGWGDVFVLIFFGFVAVAATYYVQAGGISAEAWWIGAGMGALATNILVVNNYRDIETDRAANKRTLAVRFGAGFARAQFAGAHVVALLMVAVLAWRGTVGSIAATFLAGYLFITGLRQAKRLRLATGPAELIALLGDTGRHLAVTAGLLGGALLVG